MPCHHVVIGDGATAAEFSGTAPVGAGDRLTLIGPNMGHLGRGLAYQDHPDDRPWRFAYLLNSPSAAVDPEFAGWLLANWSLVQAKMQVRNPGWLSFGKDHIEAGDYDALFAPRALCGDYLQQRADTMLARQAARGVEIVRRTALATDLSRKEGGFRITLAGGETLTAESVDIATGGPAVQRFGADAGPTAFTTLYGNEDAIAPLLAPDLEIVCLGANAAMLDVLRFAQSILGPGRVRLTAITASGLLPEPIVWGRPRRAPVKPDLQGVFDSADALLSAVDLEIAGFRAEGATMAMLRPGFKTALTRRGLEKLLPSLDERRKVGDAIERRFRRGTHDSILDFQTLRKAGQVRVVRGRVDRVMARRKNRVEIRLRHADGTHRQMTAPLVINCSGAGDHRAFDLMTTVLIRNGWLRLEPSTGGLCVGAGLECTMPGLRYLSPGVTEIGERVLPFPLYDLLDLRTEVHRANGA